MRPRNSEGFAIVTEDNSTATLCGRGIWDVRIWIGLGLTFLVLNSLGNSGPASPYRFSEWILYALLLIGLWANWKFNLRKRIPIPRRLAPGVYIFLVWLFGMLFETSLTVTGQGVGGVHPDTIPSFILAQGDYIPLAVVSYFVVREWRLSFREMFFVAGGKSLTEGLIFTGVLTALILSPQFFLAPIVLGYYALAYSSFIALPLLFIDEELLWQNARPARRHSVAYFWFLGFVLALPIRIFWGLVYSPIATHLFDLPPNVAGS
jgi:nitrate reductase NapE component